MLPLCISAQQRTEYNRNGDEAMNRLDYRDARMWYEEGIINCDIYSIKQLTSIWQKDEQMRLSMRSLMNKCLNCLNVMATENDTTAMSLLVDYYDEGIGTPKNKDLAIYWSKQLEAVQASFQPIYIAPSDVNATRTRHKIDFFVGYAFALEAPFGLTIGAVSERFGGYLRFKTNASFKSHAYEYEYDTDLFIPQPGGESIKITGDKSKKKNSAFGTAGLIMKTNSWLYLSAGLGYGERTLLYPIVVTNHVTGAENDSWAKVSDYSYKGIVAEVDCMVRKDRFYVSIGCNTLNFEYVDLNLGLGIFF